MSVLKKSWIWRFSGIVIFVILILTKAEISEISDALSQISLRYFGVAILFLFLLILLKAYRWQDLMKEQKVTYPLVDCYLMYSAGLYIGIITPGRLGDFAKIFYLRNDGHSFGKSFFSVLIDRVFDVVSLLLCGFAGMLFLIKLSKGQVVFLASLATIFIITLTALSRRGESLKILAVKLLEKIVPKKFLSSYKTAISDLRGEIGRLSMNKILKVSLITLLGRFVYFLLAYLVALSLNLGLGFWQVAAIVSTCAIVTFIPISIAGIGTRDATMVFLFSALGKSSQLAIAFSISILLVYFFTGLMGLCAWMIRPLRFTQAPADP